MADKQSPQKSAITNAKIHNLKKQAQPNLAVPSDEVRSKPDIKIPGQNFWVLSYVTPQGSLARDKNGIGMKSKECMVKCSGVYEFQEDAEQRAKEIRNTDPRIDVMVVDMYDFVSVPPPPIVNLTVRKHYTDERLAAMMYAQQKAAQYDRQIMEARKKRDEDKALQVMRKKTGNPNFEFPKPPAEVQKMHEENVASAIPARAPRQSKYTAEEIGRIMKEMVAQNKDKAFTEDLAAEMMEKLLSDKIVKMTREESENNEILRRENERIRQEDLKAKAEQASREGKPVEPVVPTEYI